MTPTLLRPRRGDRSRDEAWIRDLLRRGEVAVFSAVLDGRPFCIPRLYVYDPEGEAVYVHGAFGGEMGRALRSGGDGEGAPMTVVVFETGRFLPDQEALEFSLEYASVVASGPAVQVGDPEEAERSLRLLMEKYAPHLVPGRDYRPITGEEVERTSVIRVDIESWSGKQKIAPADFPGAYRFEDVR